MEKKFSFFCLVSFLAFIGLAVPAWAQQNRPTTATAPAEEMLTSYPVIPNSKYIDPLKYTLGPEDVVQIEVMRHPEFSGTYPINVEGKLQYKFVGDIDVDGLTKKELEDKIAGALSKYVVSPEVNVTVIEYKSKVIYVLGEVASPGKYYMRAESIPIREAVIQAGLPLQSAALRKCRIVTPTKKGLAKVKFVDLYAVLYGGRLNYNINLYAGDVLYVPCTIMAKVIRVISPVSTAVGLSSTPTQDVGAARKGQAVAEGRAVTY